MLIRSQDKRKIIPLDKFAIGITKDNYVCATSNMYASPMEVSAGVLGGYSTEEKAIKVLDMISEFYIRCDGTFQMPQDSEVK